MIDLYCRMGPGLKNLDAFLLCSGLAPVNDLQNAHTRKLTASASLQQDASANLEFT